MQRVLISTTSWFISEFVEQDLLITHAWPSFGDRAARSRMLADRNARGAFVAAFSTEDYEKAPGVMVLQYAGYGEMFAAGKSVLFGKRFDAHGSPQNEGQFHLPDLATHHINDVQGGQPVVEDKDVQKMLARVPTIMGLERATRYMILRFAQTRLGLDLAPTPEAESPPP